MAVRFIALDLDGTLLNSASEIPRANLEAIAAAVEAGIQVALVTGRRYDFTLPVARQISSPLTLIVNNGALVKSHHGETLLRYLLPREAARDVILRMHEFRSSAAIVFDRVREHQIVYESMNWEDPRRHGYYLRNREFISQMSPLEAALTEDPIQVMYSGSVQPVRAIEALLRSGPVDQRFSLAVTYYEERDFGMVDVIRPNCSKGSTLAEWTGRLGLKREEVMAIGDNFNDLEMLEFAGVPVVMANSVPELKLNGWRETLSNDEGGVAAAICEYALGSSLESRA